MYLLFILYTYIQYTLNNQFQMYCLENSNKEIFIFKFIRLYTCIIRK